MIVSKFISVEFQTRMQFRIKPLPTLGLFAVMACIFYILAV